ncbi:MAG: GNAT family N-acetyltransferase [Deltaproteobacteria bacterium]|nr:GNAT family N-acetyltransferase [Deltaproteobacteria bacterium]
MGRHAYNMSGRRIIIRNFSDDDFNRYVTLHVESGHLDPAGRFAIARQLRDDLGHPKFKPQTDLWVADLSGVLVGYLAINREPEIGRALLAGCVHPQHRRKGIATKLLTVGLQGIRASGIQSAQASVQESNAGARNFLNQMGFAHIRYFAEMRLTINTIQLPANREDAVTSRRLAPGEAKLLTQIQNRCFADSWGFNPNTEEEIAYRLSMQSRSPQEVILTYEGNHPVGYCWTITTGKENESLAETKGQIHMLGVDPDYRRQEIGRAILRNGLKALNARSLDVVELTVDGKNTAARALYESVGFEVYAKTEWYEKILIQ